MKPLHYLVRYFYSVERRSSQEQLRDDFSEFPPTPLRCDSISGEFNIVRVRGLGEVLHTLRLLRRGARAVESDPQSLSIEFATIFPTEQLATMRSSLIKFGRAAVLIESALLALVFSIVGIVLAIKSMRPKTNMPRSFGQFIAVEKDAAEILVHSGNHHRARISEIPTISHEHIHLLQYRNPERHSRHLKTPELLLHEQVCKLPGVLYLLEKNEVEARLHECILAGYRSHRQLPLSLAGFLGLLAASDRLGEGVDLALTCSGIPFEQDVSPYLERDALTSKDLDCVLLFIRTDELRCRFITEVLPVMYGNLLRYYGDTTASCSFLAGIERPNLYDELYGVEDLSPIHAQREAMIDQSVV